MVYDYKDIILPKPSALTIGNFDGVHLGHRNLIERVKAAAEQKGLSAAVLTFSPHPQAFFEGDGFLRITDDKEKALILKGMMVNNVVFLDFNNALASLSPYDYVAEVLVKAVNCKHIVVGDNHFFGKNKSGDVKALKDICDLFNITVEVAPSVYYEGHRAASKRVRECLNEGDIKTANGLLYEPYFICGKIVSGKSIGRTLGFPTINLSFSKDKLLPKNGVYFTKAYFNGDVFNGITNVGVRPTVKGGGKTVETFLFDFNRQIYGEKVMLKFLKRQRDEVKFSGLSQLKEAIEMDKQTAVKYFKGDDII